MKRLLIRLLPFSSLLFVVAAPTRNITTMKRLVSMIMLALVAVVKPCAAESASANGQPNIVFIEVDDLAYTHVRALGSKTSRVPIASACCRC